MMYVILWQNGYKWSAVGRTEEMNQFLNQIIMGLYRVNYNPFNSNYQG